MQLGMIGLGRMGANMVERLLAAGHECVVYDTDPARRAALTAAGAREAHDLAELCAQLRPPRALWIMVPAAAVETVLDALQPLLEADDLVVDGGNSYYKDAPRRAHRLAADGVHFLDCGTSGGVWGRARGYCLTVGGAPAAVARLEPILAALAPGAGTIPRTPGYEGMPGGPEWGYLHCGPSGAGHFVKMVHNGIEYGLMAAYAEGFNLLARAAHLPAGDTAAPRYDFDVAAIAEVWRRGSVIGSWLLDLSAAALHADPQLRAFGTQVADSGEGRWTGIAAIESSTPAPVLTAALFARFASRDEDAFANRLLAALRYQFGGHRESAPD